MPDVVEVLKVWGIDEEAFRQFMQEGASINIEEQEGLSLEERAFADMTVGFFLGFQVAQEIELRKEGQWQAVGRE